ncbi:hypothetical protein HK105_204815 [Polyrhizophydium stewartii]|uniref:EF-hand domain-containing protein n=1 Tax=Polyrhizophydium stewartii TaxID=2732419 RepID=A0ABR4N7Z7_9FUNG
MSSERLVDADFLGGSTPVPDNPLSAEDVVSRRARIKALFDRLDQRGQGYLDADSIVRRLDEIAFGQTAPPSTTKPALQAAPAPSPQPRGQSQIPPPVAAAQRNALPATATADDGVDPDAAVRGVLENIPLGSTVMYARELVKACDKTADGRITFAEFESFVKEKEKELLELFQEIDTGNDNVIHLSTLLSSVRRAGIDVSEAELQQFIEHVDKDKDGVIDFFEWRDYLLLLPHRTTLKNVLKFYNTVSNVDFNSDAVSLPDAISISGLTLRLKYFLAGGIAGAVSRTATAPLDRLKVLLQTQTLQTKTSYFNQLASAVRKIYEDGGLMSFYRGNGLNIIKIIPESALKFFVFEYSKDLIRGWIGRNGTNASAASTPAAQGSDSLGLVGRFVAGGIAGLVSQFAIYPIETTKTCMMAQITNGPPHKLARLASSGQLHKDPSVLATVRHLWAEGGIRAFYRGCIPALIGIVPYAGVDLAVFETLKQSYVAWNRSRADAASNGAEPTHLSTPLILMFGMTSGTCGAVLVYPLSLVRTRLQAQGTPSHPTFYRNSFEVVQKTFVKEGFAGFYKGLMPTLLKVLPAVSISYWVYEKSKCALEIP